MNKIEMRKTFISNLKKLLADRGKNQSDIAKDLNLNPSTVSKWMTEENYPRIEMMERLAQYLNVQVNDLMGKQGIPKTIGQRIKHLREVNGLTQEELAKAIKVSSKAVSSWELDNKIPRLYVLERLAKYFEVKLSDFAEDSEAAFKVDSYEREMIINYRSLSPQYQEMLMTYIEFLKANNK